MKKLPREHGQALILFVFAIVGLVAITGLAVDGGLAYSDRRAAQNAADAVALKAALDLAKQNPDWNASALAAASSNGFSNDGVQNTVQVSHPPASGEFACASAPTICNQYVQVIITSRVKTNLAAVVGLRQISNTVQSIARVSPGGSSSSFYPNSSVVTTNTGSCSCFASANLSVGGSSNLQVAGGDLISSSTDPSCTQFSSGHTQMEQSAQGNYCGSIITSATSGTFFGVTYANGCSGTNKTGVSAPQAPAAPNMTGLCGPAKSDGTPGTYNSFPPHGVTSLQPGLYCVHGNFHVGGGNQLTGHGVTIYMMDNAGSIAWYGQSRIDLTAAAPGDTSAIAGGAIPGLLVYAPKSNHNTMDMSTASQVNLQGTWLTPGAGCSYIGQGSAMNQAVQFVCSSWSMSGNAHAQLVYDASKFYLPQLNVPMVSLAK